LQYKRQIAQGQGDVKVSRCNSDQFYKPWHFFTGCYTFDNFFSTEGNGQDSAEFIDFRKQLLPHSKQNKNNQNYQTLSSFYDKHISKTAKKRHQYEVEYIQV
jgi:hypothetical protein